MLIAGTWLLCPDGIVRPTFQGDVCAAEGSWVDVAEKSAFKEAADLSGLTLSAWVREPLRQVAHKELIAHGRQVAFLQSTGE